MHNDPKQRFFSQRLGGLKGSAMLALVAKTAELRAQGRDLIGLAAGEPDFDTPAHIQEAAFAAIKSGHTRYTAVEGTLELRGAVVEKFKRENGLDFSLREILVGSGGKQVIYNALMATVDAGDEVIIPMPGYPTYVEITALCGGVPVFAECPAEMRFKLSPELLERSITARTKWLILCSPSNPTGVAYTESELLALAEVLERHPHVHVMSDDIYEHLLFNGQKFATLAAVAPALRDRILTVNGVSKTYCMTGWRIGYGAGPESLIKEMSKLQSQCTSSPCAISQSAAVAALNGSHEFLNEHKATYRLRRDLVVDGLNAAQYVSCPTPDGAFYVFPSCKDAIGRRTPSGKVIASDADFANYLLEDAEVVLVPGSVFGAPDFFRISYAADTQLLREACGRIAQATGKLQ